MKVDFDGLRMQAAQALNNLIHNANHAKHYEGYLLMTPDRVANCLKELRDCVTTLLCLEGEGYTSITDKIFIYQIGIEIEDDDEDEDDEIEDESECKHDGKINPGHHADQPSWCAKCGQDL